MSKLIFGYKQVISSITSKTPKGDQRSNKEQNIPIVIDGVKISRVTVPKEKGGGHDIPFGTIKSIRDQLLLNNNEFKDFINCPMSKTDYIETMKKKYPYFFT